MEHGRSVYGPDQDSFDTYLNDRFSGLIHSCNHLHFDTTDHTLITAQSSILLDQILLAIMDQTMEPMSASSKLTLERKCKCCMYLCTAEANYGRAQRQQMQQASVEIEISISSGIYELMM